jgi:hypothetical protein
MRTDSWIQAPPLASADQADRSNSRRRHASHLRDETECAILVWQNVYIIAEEWEECRSTGAVLKDAVMIQLAAYDSSFRGAVLDGADFTAARFYALEEDGRVLS